MRGAAVNNLIQALLVVGSGFVFDALVAVVTLLFLGMIDIFRGGD